MYLVRTDYVPMYIGTCTHPCIYVSPLSTEYCHTLITHSLANVCEVIGEVLLQYKYICTWYKYEVLRVTVHMSLHQMSAREEVGPSPPTFSTLTSKEKEGREGTERSSRLTGQHTDRPTERPYGSSD